MGAIDVEGMDTIPLGAELRARIHFPKPESISQFLTPDQSFEIAEGPRKVGEGRLLKRLDHKK